jgi:hypothetical protein
MKTVLVKGAMQFVAALGVWLATAGAASAAAPDEVARFLAGLPLHGTALERTAQQAAWVQHAMEFDDAWAKLEERQLSKLRAWAPEYLAPQYGLNGNVFYYFSGPDFLYAHQLFPNARNYVLVAREPVGAMPRPEQLASPDFAPALGNLRKALNSALSFSFFITQDMKSDLAQQQLSGTLPVILVFLARGGCRVNEVDLIGLDASGAITAAAKPATRGVRIEATGAHGRPMTVYYFEADLGDWVLKQNDAVLRFCDSLGRGSSLLKAASYLLHGGGFDRVREDLLRRSDLIVQDDSGIPVRFFDPAKWQLRLCGRYAGPIEIFKQHHQADLAAAYAQTTPLPMGFSFGYRWHPRESGLILARPK